MKTHVYIEIAIVGKALVAYLATEGHLARMSAHVIGQTHGLTETFATDGAHVRPLTTVSA